MQQTRPPQHYLGLHPVTQLLRFIRFCRLRDLLFVAAYTFSMELYFHLIIKIELVKPETTKVKLTQFQKLESLVCLS